MQFTRIFISVTWSTFTTTLLEKSFKNNQCLQPTTKDNLTRSSIFNHDVYSNVCESHCGIFIISCTLYISLMLFILCRLISNYIFPSLSSQLGCYLVHFSKLFRLLLMLTVVCTTAATNSSRLDSMILKATSSLDNSMII